MPNDIGDRLRETRTRLGWNQSDLGEKSGVSPVTISQIERGANTTTETLQKLADAMEVSVGSLFCPTFTEEEIDRAVREISFRFKERIDAMIRECFENTFQMFKQKL